MITRRSLFALLGFGAVDRFVKMAPPPPTGVRWRRSGLDAKAVQAFFNRYAAEIERTVKAPS